MIERVLHHYGRIDILVNNCGGPKPGFFPEFTAQDWKSACNEILLSAVALIQGALPEMRKNKWGRIVNITSIAVFEYIENLLLSSTFRTALTSFSRVFARQNAQFNITINNVAPGYTLTERIYELSEIKAKKLGISREAVLTEMEASIPMKRMADPSEIAAATAFFCSVDADYITGNTLVVDGGFIHNIH
jgi:3-oxoacyl-[acyl-carrier protein] reductase